MSLRQANSWRYVRKTDMQDIIFRAPAPTPKFHLEALQRPQEGC
ncbi:hypothetical protein [Polaromonas sp. CG9_12]|nr:hypothetical protein [Polaromonas sp. CG9_12]